MLKLTPDDEMVQLAPGRFRTSRACSPTPRRNSTPSPARRRNRGDKAGAAEIVVRLGSLDPGDFDAPYARGPHAGEMGDDEGAAARFRALYGDLLEKDREADALQALRQAVELVPHDQESRLVLARAAVLSGDFESARAYLDRHTAGDDPTLQMALLEMDLRSGDLEEARELMRSLLARGTEQRQRVTELAWATAPGSPEAAFVAIEALVDAAEAAGDFADAAALLHEFATRVPNQIPALLRMIEVCVDGGLETTMYEAQAQLADAYLSAGQAVEARVIAEDLVAREPWERAHIERFRRALMLLRVPDPDMLIASRLSGEVPFTAHDVFAERAAQMPAAEPLPAVEEPLVVETFAPDPPPVEEPPPAPPAEVPVLDGAPPAESSEEIDLNTALGDFSAPLEKPQPIPVSRLPTLQDNAMGDDQGQSGADQSAQHMTLARTYIEMGLLDEAVGPLEIASKAPRFRFEAASQLGRIFRDQGDVAKAIEWLERAAEAPAPNEEDSRALLYDLGSMVEASGDTARALAVFLELQSEAGDYRDVAERVERLARVETGG